MRPFSLLIRRCALVFFDHLACRHQGLGFANDVAVDQRTGFAPADVGPILNVAALEDELIAGLNNALEAHAVDARKIKKRLLLAFFFRQTRHDEHGPVWPVSIAPWQVHLCAVRHDDASVGAYADGLYDALRQAGVEVIYDDRPVSAGVMFADADLLGVPLRVVVSPRNMKRGSVEVSARDRSFSEQVPLENAAARLRQLLGAMLAAVRSRAAAAEAE